MGVVVSLFAAGNDHCAGQVRGQIAQRRTEPRLGTIDVQSRWAFRAIEKVTVSSPIIRLGDVVRPLDPNMVGWERLERSPIGLVPLGGRTVTIERDRLSKTIRDAEATPLAIDWVGPTEIRVTYQPAAVRRAVGLTGDLSDSQNDSSSFSPSGSFSSSGLNRPRTSPSVSQTGYPAAETADSLANETLTARESERIIHWILQMLDRDAPEIPETYRVEVEPSQPGLIALKKIAGITSVRPISEISEDRCLVHVVGRSVYGAIESDLSLTLEKHPTVAVSPKSLPRGHVIQRGDLIRIPLPADELGSEMITDPDDVIGMEVHGVVRSNRPINRADLGAPIVVHRGDLVEIVVVGGGITVSTSAKSLGNGAIGDLVEIELMRFRKRLVARVVNSGTVEIVTRAPRLER